MKKFFDKLNSTWGMLGVIGLIVTASVTGFAEIRGITEQVAANTDDRVIRTYDHLLRKYQAQKNLSIRDQRAFCSAARHLRIKGPVVKKLCG